jgi:benzoate-CoA ligase
VHFEQRQFVVPEEAVLMNTSAQAPAAPAAATARNAADAIPRRYNFAEDMLARNLAAGRAGKAAYIDPRGTWSFGQLADRVARFGKVLRSLGIAREQRILICLTDTIDWPTAFLGAVRAGMVPVPANTLMSESEYRFILDDSRARLLVVSEELYPRFADLIASYPDLEHILVSGTEAHGHTLLEQALQSAAGPDFTAETAHDDICFWLYTSSSSGRPRAVVHTHAAPRLTNDLYAAAVLGLTERDVVFSVAKLFFAYGFGNALTFPLSVGATTVLMPERPTAGGVAALLRQHGVTTFFSVPTFYAAFLTADPVEPRKLQLRCCVSAGEELPAEIGRRWAERFGVDILDGIGTTEMLHIFLSNRMGEVRYGTLGKPVPGYEVRIVGDCDGEVAPGEIGNLQIRGPTAAIMYWNDPEETRATFAGEWTRAGDKVLKDEDGFYVYRGRRDDMLKVGGIYVAPCEIEEALMRHPDVREAAVVGWPDEDRLIKAKAIVVLNPPAKPSEATARALRELCRKKLAAYKYPRWIEFRRELPKGAGGEVQRFKLRADAP